MPVALGLKFDPELPPAFYQLLEGVRDAHTFCVARDPGIDAERVGYVDCFQSFCSQRYDRLPSVTRLATEEETTRWHDDSRRRHDALQTAREKAKQYRLPMKIVAARLDDAHNRILFEFTAERRIDFRELVRDLAGQFKARIEMWQIGSRQGAAQKDGYGSCGRHICCAEWLHEFGSVSLRHARDQDIHQPPPKLSGLCGRLRCCLRFEHETYCELAREAPRVGRRVRDDEGDEGRIVDRNLLTSIALVDYGEGRMTWVAFDRLDATTDRPNKSRKAPPSPESRCKCDRKPNPAKDAPSRPPRKDKT